MKNFDIAKYLKEHQLGSYGILNQYVDLEPLAEADTNPLNSRDTRLSWNDRNYSTVATNTNYSDCMRKAKTEEDRENCEQSLHNASGYSSTMMDYPAHFLKKNESEIEEAVDLEKIHLAIDYLKSQGLSDEEIMQIPDHLAMYNQYLDKSAMTEEEQNEDWDPSARTSPQVSQSIGIKNIIGRATEALAKAGLTKNQILMFASAVDSDPKSLDKAISTLAFE